MLKSLYIKNYALIESLEIDFESGFSAITGETGAGKSIILGALSLILGQRADVKAIKQGEDKCVIEGEFEVSAYDLKDFVEELGIDYDPQSYILRREILSSGKSRAFINDTPVTLNELKELGSQLIDIHSQHQNLLLGDAKYQMRIVDLLSGTMPLLKEYQNAYTLYRETQKKLNGLIELAEKSKADEDYFRFQYTALSEAKLSESEQAELEQEQELLNHAEEIKSALYKINNLLSGDEDGVVSTLKEAFNTASSLKSIYVKAGDPSQRLETAYLDLRDLAQEVERFAEEVEFNPERLILVQERLDMIFSLQQKHKVSSVAELIKIQQDLEAKLNNIDSFDQQIEELQKEATQKYEKMISLAEELSCSRKQFIPHIEQQLIEKVAYLGIPNVRFECKIEARETADLFGVDDLVFMFSANKNVPLQPVAEVASGGEISRVMLVLKSMIANAAALPTIVFDEIDTGVSGEIADKMGQIMQQFGQQMQVIAITHLPQIAARGNNHYFVYKVHGDVETTTNLRRLTEEERVREIAQMLSGSQITDAAIENAKVMLKK